MTKGDLNGNGLDELIIDLGPQYGIWIYQDDGTWWQLHNVSPESMAAGELGTQ